MTDATPPVGARPIHPFPARMAPAIAWEELRRDTRGGLRVLDPMAGSGTSLIAARGWGHVALGLDTDPLAVLIANASCGSFDGARVEAKAEEVLVRANARARRLPVGQAYPLGADEETRSFVRFWFDPGARRQLAALARTISRVREPVARQLLWCAFSRLIITKRAGASLAMDVSHSRPHRVYDKAPIKPLEEFLGAARRVVALAPFRSNEAPLPEAAARTADARRMPLPDGSVDVVITSPPYLNAIDYMRGHRLSLVWMGYSIQVLRKLRSTNVGAEVSRCRGTRDPHVTEALRHAGEIHRLPPNRAGMVVNYLCDMSAVLAEIARVLIPRGRTVLVVGNSTMRGAFIANSDALTHLATLKGFSVLSSVARSLPDNRRYLPPPSSVKAGAQLQTRMRQEVVLTLSAPPI